MIRQIVESCQKNFEENFPSKPKTEGFSLWGWWKSATPGIEEINDDILDLQTLDQVNKKNIMPFYRFIIIANNNHTISHAYLNYIIQLLFYY